MEGDGVETVGWWRWGGGAQWRWDEQRHVGLDLMRTKWTMDHLCVRVCECVRVCVGVSPVGQQGRGLPCTRTAEVHSRQQERRGCGRRPGGPGRCGSSETPSWRTLPAPGAPGGRRGGSQSWPRTRSSSPRLNGRRTVIIIRVNRGSLFQLIHGDRHTHTHTVSLSGRCVPVAAEGALFGSSRAWNQLEAPCLKSRSSSAVSLLTRVMVLTFSTCFSAWASTPGGRGRSEEQTSELQSR